MNNIEIYSIEIKILTFYYSFDIFIFSGSTSALEMGPTHHVRQESKDEPSSDDEIITPTNDKIWQV